jgi:hypothetical protein
MPGLPMPRYLENALFLMTLACFLIFPSFPHFSMGFFRGLGWQLLGRLRTYQPHFSPKRRKNGNQFRIDYTVVTSLLVTPCRDLRTLCAILIL